MLPSLLSSNIIRKRYIDGLYCVICVYLCMYLCMYLCVYLCVCDVKTWMHSLIFMSSFLIFFYFFFFSWTTHSNLIPLANMIQSSILIPQVHKHVCVWYVLIIIMTILVACVLILLISLFLLLSYNVFSFFSSHYSYYFHIMCSHFISMAVVIAEHGSA